MLNSAQLERQPRVFQSLTGLWLAAFAQLLPAFRAGLCGRPGHGGCAAGAATANGSAAVGARPPWLCWPTSWFSSCSTSGMYPTQEAQGFFFGLSQGQACTWIHRLTPVLDPALGYEQQLPARQPAAVTQVLGHLSRLGFHRRRHGTAQIQRPKDAERQRHNYSGKKKRHTVKNIVITDKSTRKIKALGPTCEGKNHDKAAVDETEFPLPRPAVGSGKIPASKAMSHPARRLTNPRRNRAGVNSPPLEKETNQAISHERIGVEHSLGGGQVFRIVHDVYRNHRPAFDDLVMAVGLRLA